ncbi:MAG: phosphotransferase [Candidatus ainarchaeum sp.]|nr:phosphotransferase [Candidatus ainarchaeum sp.]
MAEGDLFKKRIGFKGRLEDISEAVCKCFGLGAFVSNRLVAIGYEDFNFALQTKKGNFFVKVFADFRTLQECKRYVKIMEKALESNVVTPKLLEAKNRHLQILNVRGKKLRLVAMDFIEGKTLFESKEKLADLEIRFLAKQAAIINSMKIKPKFVYDHWAITSFLKEFRIAKKFLDSEDLKKILPLVKDLKALEINKLPHCFVHGDLTKTNIMKDKNGKLWLIDFACANYYPRIQELAVMACTVLFEQESKSKTEKNIEIVLEEYQKIIPLTQKELEALPTYIKLGHAIYVILATYTKCKKGINNPENEYFLELGRVGLLQSME